MQYDYCLYKLGDFDDKPAKARNLPFQETLVYESDL